MCRIYVDLLTYMEYNNHTNESITITIVFSLVYTCLNLSTVVLSPSCVQRDQVLFKLAMLHLGVLPLITTIYIEKASWSKGPIIIFVVRHCLLAAVLGITAVEV